MELSFEDVVNIVLPAIFVVLYLASVPLFVRRRAEFPIKGHAVPLVVLNMVC